jgi:hypothetical protein
MTFYGLADYRLTTYGQVIDFYISPDEAEAALSDILSDEPEWEDELGVVTIVFPFSRHLF